MKLTLKAQISPTPSGDVFAWSEMLTINKPWPLMERRVENNRGKLISAILMVAAFLSSGGLIFGKTPDWFVRMSGIYVLRSTRSDVESAFPDAKVLRETDNSQNQSGGWGLDVSYRTDEGSLEVGYSTGSCPENRNLMAFDVPEDVVTEIRFFPTSEIPLKNLDLNLKGFSVVRIDDVPTGKIFQNHTSGRTIVTNQARYPALSFYRRPGPSDFCVGNDVSHV